MSHIAQTAAPAAKAIFVDGPSANKVKESLGIRFVNFAGLYRVLVNLVGECRVLACAPVMTAHPERVSNGNGLAKQLAAAGFELFAVTSQGSRDDAYLKNEIARLEPHVVREIVLVSSDKDFVPVLRAKVSQGIVVYWVSTMSVHPDTGRHGLSRDLIALFEAKEFHFVDLGRYRREICELSRRGDVRREASASSESRTKVAITLNNKDPREHLKLASELRRLQRDFSGLTFNIIE
ncbi:MAG TPA: hypothetical protein VHD38_01655 [Candidatus Paceibacterota bacterium]|nr:hypothetical protein [Candidatus Paceibacterota bacterium]